MAPNPTSADYNWTGSAELYIYDYHLHANEPKIAFFGSKLHIKFKLKIDVQVKQNYRERCTDGEAELLPKCDQLFVKSIIDVKSRICILQNGLMTSFELMICFFLILISIILIFECVFQLF